MSDKNRIQALEAQGQRLEKTLLELIQGHTEHTRSLWEAIAEIRHASSRQAESDLKEFRFVRKLLSETQSSIAAIKHALQCTTNGHILRWEILAPNLAVGREHPVRRAQCTRCKFHTETVISEELFEKLTKEGG